MTEAARYPSETATVYMLHSTPTSTPNTLTRSGIEQIRMTMSSILRNAHSSQ